MSRTLLRFTARELGRTWARSAVLAVVFAVLATALGGGYLSEVSLDATRATWVDRLHLADVDVRFTPATPGELPSLEVIRAVPGVEQAAFRFSSLGHIERPGGEIVPVLVQYLAPGAHPPVNDVAAVRGGWLEPGHPERALVDRGWAAAAGIGIGDTIVVNPHRLASRFVIGGIGLSAEHLATTANPEDLIPEKGSLGVLYASREALDRTFPDELYNELLVRFAPSADPATATAAILDRLDRRGVGVEQTVRRNETFGYRFLDVTFAGSRSVTPVTALVLALMAALVALTSMHRTVTERRREIGCLLALGFPGRAVALCFVAIGVVPGLLGALAGAPGAIAFGHALATRIAIGSGLPSPILATSPAWIGLGAGAAIVVALLSAVPSSLALARLGPSTALHGEALAVFSGLPAPLERLLAGRTAIRYGVRNVFRRAHLSIATAAVIALAIALPAGFVTAVSSWHVWSLVSTERVPWDLTASFQVPLREAQVEELFRNKGIAAWEGYVQGYAAVRRRDGSTEELRLRGLPVGRGLADLTLTAGRTFSSDDADEIVLNTAFPTGAPPRVGDTVTVLRRGADRPLKVVGLVTDATLSTAYLPRTTATRIFGLEGKLSGAYLRRGAAPSASAAPAAARPPAPRETNADLLETIDVDELATPAPVRPVASDPRSALLAEELVASVRARSDLGRATDAFIAGLDVILRPFIVLSGVLAFSFLLGVLGFLLRERETEYATLRSLGYSTAEIARIVLTEVLMLAVVGAGISLGAWWVIVRALRAPMDATWLPIPSTFSSFDFATCSLPTVVFLVFAALPAIRAIMQTNISAALRGRAIG